MDGHGSVSHRVNSSQVQEVVGEKEGIHAVWRGDSCRRKISRINFTLLMIYIGLHTIYKGIYRLPHQVFVVVVVVFRARGDSPLQLPGM